MSTEQEREALLRRLDACLEGRSQEHTALLKDCRAALSSPPPQGAQEPYPAAKAIEFAEYMAKVAEQLLEALNALHAVREEKDQFNDGDEGNRSWESIRADEDDAEQTLSDHLRGLRSDIYEFRKRAAKVAASPPSQPVELSDEQIDAIGDKWSYGKNEGSIRFEPLDFIAAVRECIAAAAKGQP